MQCGKLNADVSGDDGEAYCLSISDSAEDALTALRGLCGPGGIISTLRRSGKRGRKLLSNACIWSVIDIGLLSSISAIACLTGRAGWCE